MAAREGLGQHFAEDARVLLALYRERDPVDGAPVLSWSEFRDALRELGLSLKADEQLRVDLRGLFGAADARDVEIQGDGVEEAPRIVEAWADEDGRQWATDQFGGVWSRPSAEVEWEYLGEGDAAEGEGDEDDGPQAWSPETAPEDERPDVAGDEEGVA